MTQGVFTPWVQTPVPQNKKILTSSSWTYLDQPDHPILSTHTVPYLSKLLSTGAGCVAQVEEHLPSKYKTLNSNPVLQKKKSKV
jgi:hypothetical protein